MTTNKENNLAKHGGQMPKLKHFPTVPVVSCFPKYSDLKDTNSQKHSLMVVNSLNFLSRIPLD